MLYLNLFLLTIIIVIIIDISGFIENVEKFIAKWLKAKEIHIKLIECSFCLNWWISLIYLIVTNNLTIINISYILFLSLLTPPINTLLILLREKINNIIIKILE